jgi:dTDP-glucose pyrophosphorylase
MEVDEPQRYGVIDVDAAGQLREVIEKPSDPPSPLVNLGGYRFDAAVFPYLEEVAVSARGELELTAVFGHALADGRSVDVARYTGMWYDVGTPAAYLAAIDGLLSRWDDSAIDPSATVDPSVQISGPVAIGPHAEIGPMTYLRGPRSSAPVSTWGMRSRSRRRSSWRRRRSRICPTWATRSSGRA